jgi:hypothetical protein
MMNFALRIISFIFRRVLKHDVKSYDIRPAALIPLRILACITFLSSLKIHRPRPGLNTRTLSLIASTTNTIPPRTTKYNIVRTPVPHFSGLSLSFHPGTFHYIIDPARQEAGQTLCAFTPPFSFIFRFHSFIQPRLLS